MITLSCFIVGAIASPGTDIMSMLIMSGALVALYVISIAAAYMFYPAPNKEA